ncbi:Na(+)/H(+) antiporter subunit C [Streptomyces sp. H39-S7]|uniref:Na(+)/H(+) antiporter subunit C n=1 Tax=Streptomyces sp. H39-S7 TaxID=3004357 RepID=UPI0022AF4C84|nr:Na(+)/H(+) antiporter subunit C [Streptomyces sp. H39-S7]MCZ4118888.1 Na(+)/H(+) antiporter subunit C [Streptomyces sp. H39-S7]
MTATVALIAAGGVLFACGTVLLLARPLTRILLGAVLLGNGVNLLVLATSGPSGKAPLLSPGTDPAAVSDPFPQAMALTAIVITLALTAFLLAMAYRSWQLTGSDDVQDDVEDIRVALRAEHEGTRAELRAVIRADRARQARAEDSEDLDDELWDNVLGADR